MPRFVDVSDLSVARDYLEVPSDYDPRLDDTRTPVDGSVTLAKFDSTLSVRDSLFNSGPVIGLDAGGDQYFSLNAAAGQNRILAFLTAGVARWHIRASGDTESGSDAGSNLEILSRTDAGDAKATLVSISRSTGVIALATSVTASWSATITGASNFQSDVTIGTSSGGQRTVAMNAPAGQYRIFSFRSANVDRWHFRVDNSSESGSDAGSNLQIVSRTDAGANKTTVVDINRASGTVTLAGQLSTKASATGGSGLVVPHGAAPTAPTDGAIWTTTAGLFVRINGVTKTVTLT